MTRFLVLLFALTAALLTGAYAGAYYHLFPFPSLAWLIEGCLLVTTAVIFHFLHKRPPGFGFTQVYLFSVVTKICLFAALMVVVILADKPNASGNVVLFIVSYVLFTVLEVAVLFRKINGRNASQKIN